jgi:hypothetical protein
MTMTESECFDTRTKLDACYPCPNVDCDGVVEYETTGYCQCSECSFRTKHIENRARLHGYADDRLNGVRGLQFTA